MPPALHDSQFMVFLYRLVWGSYMDDLAEFRKRAPFLTAEEYRDIYEREPRIHEGTDNSQKCIELIIENLLGESICDVGCGTGQLVREIKQARPELTNLSGVDFILDDKAVQDTSVEWVEAPIENLPFEDNQFDTVICTHVLEHILDIHTALDELRRISAKRLIVVVPIEREHVYTFNPHFHFFPFVHSFIRVARPPEDQYRAIRVQRDIFYVEDFVGGAEEVSEGKT